VQLRLVLAGLLAARSVAGDELGSAAATPASQPADAGLGGWDRVTGPKAGTPLAIGGYSAGCVQGAVPLPEIGKGFRVARPARHRIFGHPLLIAYIRQLAVELARAKLGTLWVGDLSQPRGGPAPTGHASHQTGLDVDLWFARRPGKGRVAEPVSLVDAARKKLTPQFGKKILVLLRDAASAERVERIFVNPVIKRALCERARGDRAWLHKIRPWWGHDDHFHVRLACPADSPGCEAQPALPPGDGCDDLDWWFKDQAASDREGARARYQAKVGARPPLPDRCREVLE
jgi:penicillin-insensitive murein endopeptidase